MLVQEKGQVIPKLADLVGSEVDCVEIVDGQYNQNGSTFIHKIDLKVLLEQKGYFTNLPIKVDCKDRGVRGGKCEYCRDRNWFICGLCDRQVPYCFGASHENPEYSDYCDACWYEAFKLEEVAA